MPDTLLALEQQRASLVHSISELGDMRTGSFTGTSGNPTSHCQRPNHPGHAPIFISPTKVTQNRHRELGWSGGSALSRARNRHFPGVPRIEPFVCGRQ